MEKPNVPLNGPRIEKKMKVHNLPIRRLRQRLFNWKSYIMFDSPYTFEEDVIHVPSAVEQLEGFTNWESFGELWDLLWVGLDPRNLKWIPGRQNSPVRELVEPLQIVQLDDRSKRMMVTAEQNKIIRELEVPFKEPIPETEEDRAISEALSGRVVVDESDEDKAMRMIEKNMDMLKQQMAILNKKKK